MCKEITKKETRIALTMLNVMNEGDEEIRKDVVIDYVLNVLGIEMVEEEKELREFLEADIYESETKKAIKTFEKDEIENIKMTIQDAVMQTEDLLNNLENEQVTEIDVNDIVGLKKLLNSKKNNMKLNTSLNLKVRNVDELEYSIRRFEKLGMINEGDYRFISIEIDQTLK